MNTENSPNPYTNYQNYWNNINIIRIQLFHLAPFQFKMLKWKIQRNIETNFIETIDTEELITANFSTELLNLILDKLPEKLLVYYEKINTVNCDWLSVVQSQHYT